MWVYVFLLSRILEVSSTIKRLKFAESLFLWLLLTRKRWPSEYLKRVKTEGGFLMKSKNWSLFVVCIIVLGPKYVLEGSPEGRRQKDACYFYMPLSLFFLKELPLYHIKESFLSALFLCLHGVTAIRYDEVLISWLSILWLKETETLTEIGSSSTFEPRKSVTYIQRFSKWTTTSHYDVRREKNRKIRICFSF